MLLQLRDYDSHAVFREDSAWYRTKASIDVKFKFEGFVTRADNAIIRPPEHIPDDIAKVFFEASKCVSVECWNAAATMLRLCVDIATRPLLPEQAAIGEQPNSRQKRDLGLRIQWLIEHNFLPVSLRELASAVREDGNDGAHAGTLSKADAEDLLDFTTLLLERLFTEPKRLSLAAERRNERRASPGPNAT